MKTVSDRARNPSNQADPYELKAIEYFKNNSNEHESFKREQWKATIRKRTWHGRLKNIKKDGTSYWVDANILPITDANGDVKEYISIRYDVTESLEQKNELKLLANTDLLTK